MKTDTELEALLRATLSARAGEVTRAAALAPAAQRPAAPRPLTRRWLPMLAAAAAVLAVALAIAFAGGGARRAPTPATQSPTLNSTPTPSPTPIVRSCTVPLPASWTASVRSAAVEPDGSDLQPLAVAPDGTVLASRGANPDTQQFSAVVITPDRAATTIMQLPAHVVMDAHPSGASKDWAVFGTRNVAWTNDVVLWAVDLHHQDATTKIIDLTPQVAGGGRTLQDWDLIGDFVYFTVSDKYASAHFRLYRFGLRNHATTEIASGSRLTMQSVYGSLSYRAHPTPVTWGPQVVVVPGDIPQDAPEKVTDGETSIVTDGMAVAWSEITRSAGGNAQQTAYWWSPGAVGPVIALRRSTSDPQGNAAAFGITSVAGPFVFVQTYARTATLVVDTRTGAVANWPAPNRNGAWLAGPAAGGRLPVVLSSAKFGPNTLYVPQIGSLPALTCR